ncbi:MAG: CoA transferase [Alphaproteobacteria bacterium]|nr:CoA transferase [Alphaproteobacteria bacterium]
MAGALDGITVLDLTTGRAGALATMFLCDHGARVLRLATGEGIRRSDGFRIWDRGKTVIDCDAGDEHVVAQLTVGADVLIEDLAPTARPSHLAFEALAALNPRLVVCSLTAYGNQGPLAGEPPVDDLVLARLGVLAGLPGFRDGPIHAAHPLPSVGAGLLAALGIAAALFAREATGAGRFVETSLVSGALLYHPKVIGENLQPNVFQTNPFGSAPFYSVYECADGEWLQLGCVHPGFIARAAELMGIADVLADPVYGRGQAPRTGEADTHLRELVRDVMITRSSTQWAAAFEAGDIPFARAQTNKDALVDPQVAHNAMLIALDDPEVGRIEQMGSPIKMSATPSAVRGPRPADAFAPADEVAGVKSAADGARRLATASTDLPLAGVRVLEITNLIAGPIAGRLLADIGADVIKLEPPAGDISRPIGRTYFYSINYAKRSIAVDTASPDGKAVVRRIAQSCDVLLANLRPGATARMGIGHEADPDLVEAQISGYGLTGPYAHRPGIDPLAQALIGLERAQGGTGNPPSFTSQLAPTDFTTGTMAALGTVLALFARRRGKARGQRVAVNLLDGGIVLSSEWFARYAGQPARPLADQGQHGPTPFHRLYACRDGYVYVAADTEAEQSAFIALLGLQPSPVTAASGDVHPNDSPFGKAAAAALAELDCGTALARLASAQIPAAPALAPESEIFFDDPHTHFNAWSVTRNHPTAGALTAVCNYIKFGAASSPDRPILPTPLLGEHADAVLCEAGFDDAEIAGLRADGLIVTET